MLWLSVLQFTRPENAQWFSEIYTPETKQQGINYAVQNNIISEYDDVDTQTTILRTIYQSEEDYNIQQGLIQQQDFHQRRVAHNTSVGIITETVYLGPLENYTGTMHHDLSYYSNP